MENDGEKTKMRKAVFLDRDGTINVDRGYLYRIEDFTYIDGAAEALRMLAGLGYLLVVVTNQSGIARGYYTEEDFDRLNRWMLRDLADKGIPVAKTYFCPHHPMGKVAGYRMECGCRKPGTGMFWQAQREWGIDMERSFAVGDRLRDLSVCRECGVQGILLGGEGLSRREEKLQEGERNREREMFREAEGFVRPLWTAGNLLEAAWKIRDSVRVSHPVQG